jgi:proteasome lid subunit RPN8/RPN11
MEHITLPRTLINSLLHHAQSSPEQEICGLIGATTDRASSVYPVTNIAEQPAQRFLLDPQGQIDAMREMRERGEEMFAIYHSHPTTPAAPSEIDLDLASYPDLLYLIISLNTKGVLEMRGFRLNEENPQEVVLKI